MHRRVKNPLIVRDVIIPHKSDDNKATSSRNSALRPNGGTASGYCENSTSSFMKIGEHEVKQVMGLVKLHKKPVEDYFVGTRKKKQTKKKEVKHHWVVIPPSEFFCDRGHSSSNVEGICKAQKQHQTEKSLTKEEKTEMNLLHLKIYKYEKMRESVIKKRQIKQRAEEKNYIQQLENLTETWWAIRKKRNRLKYGEIHDMDCTKPVQSPKTGISATEQNDESEPLSGKSEKVKETVKGSQPVHKLLFDDDFKDEFFEKLVFVDEENDDFDSQNSQVGRNLRKINELQRKNFVL